MRVLWAYLADVATDRVGLLLLQTLPQLKQSHSLETGNGQNFQCVGHRCEALIQETCDRIWPIEVEVRLFDDSSGLAFATDNIAFGEWIVDNLACTAVVDCDGRYNPALSDYLVRITSDRIESVMIPNEPSSIDETMTKLIKLRG